MRDSRKCTHVVQDRLAIVGDQLTLSVHRFTVCRLPKDRALGTAERLFRSPRYRLGILGIDEVPDEIADVLDYSRTNFAIVSFERASEAMPSADDRFGHSYFRNVPTMSSDLVLMLRDDLDPAPPGRPLERIGRKFWRVPPAIRLRRQENNAVLHGF